MEIHSSNAPLPLERGVRAGDLVNGLYRGLADGSGCPLWVGESPRGREDGQWRGGFGQRTASRHGLAEGNGCGHSTDFVTNGWMSFG